MGWDRGKKQRSLKVRKKEEGIISEAQKVTVFSYLGYSGIANGYIRVQYLLQHLYSLLSPGTCSGCVTCIPIAKS